LQQSTQRKLPVLVGLCEVENDVVLNDLVAQKPIAKAKYKVAWNDGPDLRGIDCALLYDPSRFEWMASEFIPVVNPEDTAFATREIVHVTGKIQGEVFHVFVNHWPSRRGGEGETTGKRSLAANALRSKVDALFQKEALPNIIIMGDMNDEPGDSSLVHVLKAQPNDKVPANTDLVNLMYDEYKRDEGSYNFRGNWDMIDNLIVSGNLIAKKKGLRTSLDNGFIFHQPFMEYKNEKGEISPNRTYGRTYFGGISDHFPVYLMLTK
jgi:predicted extracellular nuclease